MKLTFEDGTNQDCSPSDQRQIAMGEVLVRPVTPPKRLDRVHDNPATYAKLAVVRCDIIGAGHYVMTESGLKRVKSVDR